MYALCISAVPLTAVRYPMRELARWALEEAVRLAEKPDRPIQHLDIEPMLMVRASTAPVEGC